MVEYGSVSMVQLSYDLNQQQKNFENSFEIRRRNMRETKPEFDLGEKYNVKKDDVIFDASDTPAVIMFNPKYVHNVSAAVRGCSCFGLDLLLFTGTRVVEQLKTEGKKGYRLPREERMKDYQNVRMLNDEYPFNRFSGNVTPVAVEVRENAELLPNFVHPENPVYVFGPEDGSLPQIYLKHCQRFLYIPSEHCLNLAVAINIVLYDRVAKVPNLFREYMKGW
jgi:tRNA(Leu) C34 or U34 (ribose-2'-O)-methylase TrmL